MKLSRIFRWNKKRKSAAPYYWEYYNRTHFVADRIRKLGPAAQGRVLDVGGTAKDNLLEKFGIRNVTSLNIDSDCDVVASGHKLPFDDRTFECVTCIDTLEHIPRELRLAVTRELVRVAGKAVFIVAPADTEENNRTEDIVLKYLGTCAFLKEHRRQGLVDFDEIKRGVEEMKKSGQVASIEEDDLDDLMSWAAMMIGNKVDVSDLYQELFFLENKFLPKRKALSIYL